MWFSFLFLFLLFGSGPKKSASTSEIMQTYQGLEAHRMDYVLDYLIREKYKVGEFTARWQLNVTSSSSGHTLPTFQQVFSCQTVNPATCFFLSLFVASRRVIMFLGLRLKKAGLIWHGAPSSLSGREIPGRRLRNASVPSPEKKNNREKWQSSRCESPPPQIMCASLDSQLAYFKVIWRGRRLPATL